MTQNQKARLSILFITLLWSLAPAFVKIALVEVQVFTMIAFRFAFSFVFLLILFHKQVLQAPKETYLKSLWLSIALFMVFVAVTYAIGFTTASKAGFLTCISVIFVPFLTYFILGRKPKLQTSLGIAIAVIGIGLLTLKSNLTIAPGDLLCIFASFLYAVYMIMVESFASKCEPIALAVIQMGFVSIYATLLAITIETPRLPTHSATWGVLIVLALFCTAIAFLVQTWAQKYSEAEDFALINSLQPLFSTVFAFIFLHEVLTAKEWLGAAILLIGVMTTQWHSKSKTKSKTKSKIKTKTDS